MSRGKSITHQCSHCERVTKMEMVGATESQPDRVWYRCTRCRHAYLLDLSELRKMQELAQRKLAREECTEYKPQHTYRVGEAIFHSEWNDVGKIISKVRTSGGDRAIVVAFEKLGERRLLESVIADGISS